MDVIEALLSQQLAEGESDEGGRVRACEDRVERNQSSPNSPTARGKTPKEPHAMTAAEQVLIDKIKQLPPQRMAEVEDFVDFLRAREDEQRLTHAAAMASVASFAQVWDNDEDAAYDRM